MFNSFSKHAHIYNVDSASEERNKMYIFNIVVEIVKCIPNN